LDVDVIEEEDLAFGAGAVDGEAGLASVEACAGAGGGGLLDAGGEGDELRIVATVERELGDLALFDQVGDG
jgi:hypothetical protein